MLSEYPLSVLISVETEMVASVDDVYQFHWFIHVSWFDLLNVIGSLICISFRQLFQHLPMLFVVVKVSALLSELSDCLYYYEILCSTDSHYSVVVSRAYFLCVNPFRPHKNRRATDRYTEIRWLVRWPLIDGLLHLVQRGGALPAHAPPPCTRCNSPPINGQCTDGRLYSASSRTRL